MTSTFSDFMREFERTFDSQFGEKFIVTPMTADDYFAGSPDELVSPYTLDGIMDDEDQTVHIKSSRYSSDARAKVDGSDSVVSFSVDQFTYMSPEPEENWRIKRVSTGMEFKIAYVRRDGESRAHCFLERFSK